MLPMAGEGYGSGRGSRRRSRDRWALSKKSPMVDGAGKSNTNLTDSQLYSQKTGE